MNSIWFNGLEAWKPVCMRQYKISSLCWFTRFLSMHVFQIKSVLSSVSLCVLLLICSWETGPLTTASDSRKWFLPNATASQLENTKPLCKKKKQGLKTEKLSKRPKQTDALLWSYWPTGVNVYGVLTFNNTYICLAAVESDRTRYLKAPFSYFKTGRCFVTRLSE